MVRFVYISLLCVLLSAPTLLEAWGNNDKDRVLLEKVTAITLQQGMMTNGRRVSPIPQLKCVGGSAGCHAYQPRIVQCTNTGFDGHDVQWECKAEMDDEYRFGRIEVVCEGYDYPDDPYILRGSCGLEYELDYTNAGSRSGGGQYYGGGGYHHNYYNQSSSSSSGVWSIIMLIVAGIVIYNVLKCCSGGGGGSSSSYSGYSSTGTRSGGGGGGFWTGAATGGALGYMFGSRGQGGGYYSSRPSSYGRWGSGSSSHSHSRGSRTSSGFGGTSRR